MRFFFSLLFLVCLTTAGPVWAQTPPDIGYCDAAESTADFQDCVNRRYKDAQIALNDVFDLLLAEGKENNNAASDPAVKPDEALETVQKNWLSYRDAQCGWEKDRAESAGLARVYELACLASLTEARTARLMKAFARTESAAPPEFGNWPRWMNVVAHEHPDIFWRYGTVHQTDLDCDGRAERVMTGLSVADDHEIAVVVASNPDNGKPDVALMTAPLHAADVPDEEPFLCGPVLRIEEIASPQEENDEGNCSAALTLRDGLCPALVLRRGPDGYVITREE
ncbi:MAG: DUF1311 domain-containing protein, partial [Alphaproteobacteria bacterium]|nr:DUF1311 domain-containing protein [Alphaproteobacteria bacterium]